MIRIIIAHAGILARGALAFVLGTEDDLEVVAQAGHYDELPDQMHTYRPHVTVLDLDLLPQADRATLDPLRRPGSGVLVLVEARRSGVLHLMMTEPAQDLGFLAKERPPQRLVTAVRTVGRGGQYLDPELVVSALRTASPLTARETQVLGVAAEGVPVAEIAGRLEISAGTVRNHLSRIISKSGARTRIEAVRIAREAGWI